MRFGLDNKIEHVFILGAGASVPYGLPTWKDLGLLITEKINKDTQNIYKYKKEIVDWVDKVGEGKLYDTIDKCIEMESISQKYHLNGHEIENQIFIVMKDVFNEAYKESADGWIRLLNEIILYGKYKNLEDKIAFINYNYDNILDRNLLNFNYLPAKKLILKFKPRLDVLSYSVIPVLHPHGHFPIEDRNGFVSHLSKFTETMKSNDTKYINTVSCYESDRHSVIRFSSNPIKLYILGLGGGLQVNLNNIDFENRINEIHITIKNPEMRDKVVNYLIERFKIPETEVKIYSTSEELINTCFLG